MSPLAHFLLAHRSNLLPASAYIFALGSRPQKLGFEIHLHSFFSDVLLNRSHFRLFERCQVFRASVISEGFHGIDPRSSVGRQETGNQCDGD